MSRFVVRKDGALYQVYMVGTGKNADVKMEGLVALTLEAANDKAKAASLIVEAKAFAARISSMDIDVLREAREYVRQINDELWARSKQDWYKPEELEQVEIDGKLYRPVEFWQ